MGGETTSTIAAWRHQDAREGFEVMAVTSGPGGVRLHDHDAAGVEQYDYSAPVFDFAARLTYDADGLIVDYPGIAARAR